MHAVANAIKKLPGVVDMNAVTGAYDFIVKIESDRFDDAIGVVTNQIQNIPNIVSTETLVGLNFKHGK